MARGDIGDYDNICSLIGESLFTVSRRKREQLEFAFSNGTKVAVSLRSEGATGPEVAELFKPGGEIMVEGYDD